jgi:SAM-dependent methyltransferase
MEVFNDYANYYNLFYKSKDYRGEVEYVDKLIKNHKSDTETILDLGCGTGSHAQLLAEKNYIVCGVDASEKMISIAKEIPSRKNLVFNQGDIRSLNLGNKYDIVISLFHVISYQTTNEDLFNTLNSVHDHLKEGGIFMFDCWYGPAVMMDPPTVRIKRFEDDKHDVIRIAEPTMHPNNNTVDVNYRVIIRNKRDGVMETINEKHVIRYLFIPEIKILLKQANLTLLHCEEWMTQKKPGFNTWNVIFICKK